MVFYQFKSSRVRNDWNQATEWISQNNFLEVNYKLHYNTIDYIPNNLSLFKYLDISSLVIERKHENLKNVKM